MTSSQTDKSADSAIGELNGLRVAILAETLYEDLELWYPYYRLREAGADVFVVGSGSAETYQSKHGYPVTVDAEADTVNLPRGLDARVGEHRARQDHHELSEHQGRHGQRGRELGRPRGRARWPADHLALAGRPARFHAHDSGRAARAAHDSRATSRAGRIAAPCVG